MLDEIPKNLRHLLLQRGGMAKIEEILRARQRTQERPLAVYSTRENQPAVVARNRNKGCWPCSDDIANTNVFDTATSGRTSFWSLSDGTLLGGPHKVRVNGENGRNG